MRTAELEQIPNPFTQTSEVLGKPKVCTTSEVRVAYAVNQIGNYGRKHQAPGKVTSSSWAR
jgi:hypothetical protein